MREQALGMKTLLCMHKLDHSSLPLVKVIPFSTSNLINSKVYEHTMLSKPCSDLNNALMWSSTRKENQRVFFTEKKAINEDPSTKKKAISKWATVAGSLRSSTESLTETRQ